jgi:hypothetical protein
LNTLVGANSTSPAALGAHAFLVNKHFFSDSRAVCVAHVSIVSDNAF